MRNQVLFRCQLNRHFKLALGARACESKIIDEVEITLNVIGRIELSKRPLSAVLNAVAI